MGITRREQQIIDLDESGLSISEIAAKLELRPVYVESRIRQLCRGLGSDHGHADAMALGSKQLLKAIVSARSGAPA